MQIETVRVVDDSPENEQGFKVINRDDLQPTDILFDEAQPAPAKRARRTAAPKE